MAIGPLKNIQSYHVPEPKFMGHPRQLEDPIFFKCSTITKTYLAHRNVAINGFVKNSTYIQFHDG